MGQSKRRATKIRPKAVGNGIFGRFANFDKFQSEIAGLRHIRCDYRIGTRGCPCSIHLVILGKTVAELFDLADRATLCIERYWEVEGGL